MLRPGRDGSYVARNRPLVLTGLVVTVNGVPADTDGDGRAARPTAEPPR